MPRADDTNKEAHTRRAFLRGTGLVTTGVCGVTITGETATGRTQQNPYESESSVFSQETSEPERSILLNKSITNSTSHDHRLAYIDDDFVIGSESQLLRVTNTGEIKWTATLGSPAQELYKSGDGIMVMTNDTIERVSLSGQQLWQRSVQDNLEFDSTDDAAFVLRGLDCVRVNHDGSIEWETRLGDVEQITFRQIITSDDTVYTLHINKTVEDPGFGYDGQPYLTAINQDNGTIKWESAVNNNRHYGPHQMQLTKHNDAIYISNEHEERGDPDFRRLMVYKYEEGTEVWSTEVFRTVDQDRESSTYLTSPTISGDAVYTNGSGAGTAKLNNATGEVEWTANIFPEDMYATDDGVVVLGIKEGTGHLRKINTDGLLQWDVTLGSGYPPVDTEGLIQVLNDLTPLDTIDGGYAFLDRYKDTFTIVGYPEESDDESNNQSGDGDETEDSNQSEEGNSTDQPDRGDDNTSQTDDSQSDSPPETESPTDQADTQQSDDDGGRGVFVNGEDRVVTNIDEKAITYGSILLTIVVFFYQETKED